MSFPYGAVLQFLSKLLVNNYYVENLYRQMLKVITERLSSEETVLLQYGP